MNLSKVFLANSVFALLGGLGLVFASKQLMEPYGISVDFGVVFVSQLMGSILLGIAVISYLASKLKDQESLRAISLGSLVAHAGSAVVGIYYYNDGSISSLIWIDVVLHLLFALAFWYYGIRKNYS